MSVRALVMLGVFASAGSFAETPGTELTAFGGYRIGGTFDIENSDSSYELDNSSSMGLIWNHRYEANTQWEVFYSSSDTNAELEGTVPLASRLAVETHTLQIGGTYLWQGDRVQPYLAATVGGTYVGVRSDDSQSDVFLSGSVGLGLKVMPRARVGLRLEARVHGVLTRSSTDLFCVSDSQAGACAIRIEGNVLSRLETFAGITVRF